MDAFACSAHEITKQLPLVRRDSVAWAARPLGLLENKGFVRCPVLVDGVSSAVLERLQLGTLMSGSLYHDSVRLRLPVFLSLFLCCLPAQQALHQGAFRFL